MVFPPFVPTQARSGDPGQGGAVSVEQIGMRVSPYAPPNIDTIWYYDTDDWHHITHYPIFLVTCACQHSEDHVQSILYMMLSSFLKTFQNSTKILFTFHPKLLDSFSHFYWNLLKIFFKFYLKCFEFYSKFTKRFSQIIWWISRDCLKMFLKI